MLPFLFPLPSSLPLTHPNHPRYERALRSQPSYSLLTTPAVAGLAYALLAAGNVLVLSSMWALGLTGTYLGDYFGILMDAKVESFPFNITSAPMYYGSAMSFLGSALLYGKPAGILLTVEVLVVYLVALRFEEYVEFFPSR
jgi:phosphatidylethanolamine N-methyltransferase